MEVLGAGEEDGDAGGEDLGVGDRRRQGRAVVPVHELPAVAAVADDAQPSLVRAHQDEALRAEGGHDLVGDELDDVADAGRLRQGRRHVHEAVHGPGTHGFGLPRGGAGPLEGTDMSETPYASEVPGALYAPEVAGGAAGPAPGLLPAPPRARPEGPATG